ncbi:ROK family protein [Candidatus Mycoplasma mahonii]|uniref:ROK family protein n=1 Tax=Candidatus Mycoplasma mahonii TaxID=3004105 RepID=UPI0026F2933E|nr:ROK family protein [Candidatus Mycoplasma mahonii]WKX02552.1 ROK family protein [Candidatus Mycoplasma mahonii]
MILGIDIGGTTIKIGVVKDKKIVKKYILKTNKNNVINDIIDSFSLNNINLDDIKAIGCAVPGFIDHKNGIVTLSGNLNLKNYKFKEEFERKIKRDVFVVNDANAAALGEYWVGAGSDYNSLVLYTIGAGIGGGIVINGQLIFGENGYAGEFGHGGFFQDERECTCGLKNCVEPMSSAIGIEKSLFEITGKKSTVREAAQSFIDGDSKIVEAFSKSLRPLAEHISIMESAINPAVIIIAGSPSTIGKPLTDLLKWMVEDFQHDFIAKPTKILSAKTGADAGIYGAAYWTFNNNL